MRDMFLRMEMTEQDVRTLRGIVRALAQGRRDRTGS
jgi:tRNA/rRNA methyltransferase